MSRPGAGGVDAAAAARLVAQVQRDIDGGRHTGATVLLARGGEIVLHEAIGISDPRSGRIAATEDIYATASLAKAFTAALILALVDRGALSFTTRVAEIVPEYGVRGKSSTTVSQLLNHTGGAHAGFLPPPPLTWPQSFDLDTLVEAVSAQQVAFEPGSQVYYTPFAGYAMLGAIAQRVTGRPFRSLIDEEVLSPLGMSDTSYGLEVDAPRRVPQLMTDRNPGAASTNVMESFNTLLDEKAVVPAGGAFSTAYDVFRFAEFQRLGGTLDGARVLSPAIVEYALANSTGDQRNVFWDFSRADRSVGLFPANLTLFGGYVRGVGQYLTPLGHLASPSSWGAMGSGSTLYLVDPQRELTFVFLGAGLTEGLGHFEDMRRLSDLAIAACDRA